MIVLDHLTAWELAPPELVEAAHACGYDAVSLWFHAPPEGAEAYPMIGNTPMRRATKARTADLGIEVFNIGLFVLTPGGWNEAWDGMLESGAALGARRAIVLDYDSDHIRARALLARLVERAGGLGIAVDVEFIAGSGLPSLADARALVDGLGALDCGIILDPLHLQRTGGTPADIGDAERRLIKYAQLCDGPATMSPDRWLHEGSRQRQLTGAGAFPLKDFVAALPQGVPIGLEIPMQDLAEHGIGPVERARMALDAARPFLP